MQRLTILLALAAQVLALALGQSIVVCIAPSGHVQVELAGSACCTELASTSSAPTSRLTASPADTDCGPCSDIPVTLGPAPRFARAAAANPDAVPMAMAPPAIDPAFDPIRSPGHPLDRELASSHLSHHRTTVLRC